MNEHISKGISCLVGNGAIVVALLVVNVEVVLRILVLALTAGYTAFQFYVAVEKWMEKRREKRKTHEN